MCPICRACGEPLNEIRQGEITLVECRNSSCDKRYITLPLEQYESADLSLYHQPVVKNPSKNPFAGKIFGE